MTFTCPLCREEWLFTSRLCDSCDRIRHLMTIYDKKIIMDILDKTLVVQRFAESNEYIKDDNGKWKKAGKKIEQKENESEYE